VGELNFAPGFVDHGADVPPGLPPGPAGAIQYVGAALKKSSRFTGDRRRHDCRGRQSRGAQPLDGHRSAIEAAAGILWNCNLEDRQPADRGARGLPGEFSPRAARFGGLEAAIEGLPKNSGGTPQGERCRVRVTLTVSVMRILDRY